MKRGEMFTYVSRIIYGSLFIMINVNLGVAIRCGFLFFQILFSYNFGLGYVLIMMGWDEGESS